MTIRTRLKAAAHRLFGSSPEAPAPVAPPAIEPATEARPAAPEIDIYAENARWMALAAERRFDEAIDLCRATIASPDTSFMASLFLGYAAAQTGRPARLRGGVAEEQRGHEARVRRCDRGPAQIDGLVEATLRGQCHPPGVLGVDVDLGRGRAGLGRRFDRRRGHRRGRLGRRSEKPVCSRLQSCSNGHR